MAKKQEVTKNFSIGSMSFEKGKVYSFSDEICVKYESYLKDPVKLAREKK